MLFNVNPPVNTINLISQIGNLITRSFTLTNSSIENDTLPTSDTYVSFVPAEDNGEDQRHRIATLVNADTYPMWNSNNAQRTLIINQLSNIALGRGPQSRPIINALTQRFGDPQIAAIYALGRLGRGSTTAIDTLRTVLLSDDSPPSVRAAATIVFADIAPHTEIGILGQLLGTGLGTDVNIAIANALGRTRHAIPRTIDRLISMTRSADPAQIAAGAAGLGGVGQGSETALARLRELLTNSNATVACSAAMALTNLGQNLPSTLSIEARVRIATGLVPLLSSSDSHTRNLALRTLSSNAALASCIPQTLKGQAIDALLTLLGNSNTRNLALQTIDNLGSLRSTGGSGGLRRRVTEALIPFLSDSNSETRTIAITAFNNIGRFRSSISPSLINLAELPETLRRQAATAVLPDLLSTDSATRSRAMALLNNVGFLPAELRSIVPPLLPTEAEYLQLLDNPARRLLSSP